MVDGGDVPEAWLLRDDGGQVTLLGGSSPTSGRHDFPPAHTHAGAPEVHLRTAGIGRPESVSCAIGARDRDVFPVHDE